MGVTGLWRLLGKGEEIHPEKLKGKVLAVDLSIWLHKAVHGSRERLNFLFFTKTKIYSKTKVRSYALFVLNFREKPERGFFSIHFLNSEKYLQSSIRPRFVNSFLAMKK